MSLSSRAGAVLVVLLLASGGAAAGWLVWSGPGEVVEVREWTGAANELNTQARVETADDGATLTVISPQFHDGPWWCRRPHVASHVAEDALVLDFEDRSLDIGCSDAFFTATLVVQPAELPEPWMETTTQFEFGGSSASHGPDHPDYVER